MEEESKSVILCEQNLSTSRSDSKMIGEKRTGIHSGEKHELAQKRVKIRDLESVIETAETSTHYPEPTKEKEHSVHLSFGKNDMSQVTEVPVTLDLDASQARKTGRNTFSVEVISAPGPLDLNTEARYSSCGGRGQCPEKVSLPGKHDKERHANCGNSKGVGVDLNVEDVTSSINPDIAHSHKELGHFKSRDVSESGSCTGPLEEKDPMRIWKEMKQNGFLSSSHGGIPMPKQRGRKSKIDVFKKKMELAKREQVNRFTKIAAPSGLLNELNPGIINHVRNRKQVHSIIEALVRSEKHESGNNGSKQISHPISGNSEGSKKDLEYMTDTGQHQLTFSDEEGALHSSLPSRQTKSLPATLNDSSPWILEDKVGNSETSMLERANVKSCMSQSANNREDDILALKLSSSTKASENSSSLSNEDSSNLTSVSSLSLKAATVASRWLDLLHQDIKGRLSALRRSRRRVRAVITTELPFLIAKEFSNNQENDPYVMNVSAGLPNSKIADMHRARWSALFNQMDDALSEEEKQLESWLNQVKEKQLLCDQGLQHVNWNEGCFQPLGTSENDSRIWIADRSEKLLAVNAAAASIYSTCNFLLSQS
ncbi:hypothetical protein L6164_030194 [Bauhinia variegata]|uniref:Uncharacterized protein n=1 Tax=Bauhinia variegata TaxID=167791 RepID=A0ACB9LCW7_BAUVA|nr:hypothetical protein L6164_030194 [Bauhinia variegata]